MTHLGGIIVMSLFSALFLSLLIHWSRPCSSWFPLKQEYNKATFEKGKICMDTFDLSWNCGHCEEINWQLRKNGFWKLWLLISSSMTHCQCHMARSVGYGHNQGWKCLLLYLYSARAVQIILWLYISSYDHISWNIMSLRPRFLWTPFLAKYCGHILCFNQKRPFSPLLLQHF